MLSAEFGQKKVVPWFCATQVQSHAQLRLIAYCGGDPSRTGNAATAISIASDHDRVRSRLAEARKDEIQVQQGGGQVERTLCCLISEPSIRSIVG